VTDRAQTRGAFRNLLRWYRPYLKGSGKTLTFGLIFTAIMLTCQAAIPLVLETLLHHGTWSSLAYWLIGLMVAQLVIGYFAHIAGHNVAVASATQLRRRIFQVTLTGKTLQGHGLVRSSVVSRHTTDVDHISEAFEQTLNLGIPGVLRILISLTLLTYIEWHAGVAMVVATLVFLLIRSAIGRNLITLDRQKLDASSLVGESVDEAITSPRIISGLHLHDWITSRFSTRTHDLSEASHRQGISIAKLVTGAHAAGLAGLLFVVLFAITSGQETLSAVAAALLYVEGVVRGLEALPPWIRSIQLALVSRLRVDQILLGSQEQRDSVDAFTKALDPALRLDNLSFPPNAIVGLVTDASIDPSLVLSILAAGHETDSWRETLDGHRLRTNQVNLDVMLVPDDPSGFNSTIREQLQATTPGLSDAHIRALLTQVGIDDFAISENGLDTPLGPGSALLTPNERQRLSLAIALAAAPTTLLIGPLICLADSETARPLLKIVRESNIPNILVCLRDPDLANEVDLVLYCTAKGHQLATHEELLVSSPEYAQLWSRRLSTGEVDLSSIGIESGQQENLLTRMLTERYESGDFIYRQGAAADRVVFIISGSVEIATQNQDGQLRRVAILGPGNHCGDLRLTVGEERGEHAIAVQTTVTRSLSREAISAGMMGLLDRTPAERRIVASILREGNSSHAEISARLTEFDPAELSKAIDLLLSDGALRESDGRYSVIQKRAVKAGSKALLDKLNFD